MDGGGEITTFVSHSNDKECIEFLESVEGRTTRGIDPQESKPASCSGLESLFSFLAAATLRPMFFVHPACACLRNIVFTDTASFYRTDKPDDVAKHRCRAGDGFLLATSVEQILQVCSALPEHRSIQVTRPCIRVNKKTLKELRLIDCVKALQVQSWPLLILPAWYQMRNPPQSHRNRMGQD
jgi:hypothetical protein